MTKSPIQWPVFIENSVKLYASSNHQFFIFLYLVTSNTCFFMQAASTFCRNFRVISTRRRWPVKKVGILRIYICPASLCKRCCWGGGGGRRLPRDYSTFTNLRVDSLTYCNCREQAETGYIFMSHDDAPRNKLTPNLFPYPDCKQL